MPDPYVEKPQNERQELWKNCASISILLLVCALLAVLLTVGWWKSFNAYILIFLSTLLAASVIVAGSHRPQDAPHHMQRRNSLLDFDPDDCNTSSPRRVRACSSQLCFAPTSMFRDYLNQAQYKAMERRCTSSPCVRDARTANGTTIAVRLDHHGYEAGLRTGLKTSTRRTRSYPGSGNGVMINLLSEHHRSCPLGSSRNTGGDKRRNMPFDIRSMGNVSSNIDSFMVIDKQNDLILKPTRAALSIAVPDRGTGRIFYKTETEHLNPAGSGKQTEVPSGPTSPLFMVENQDPDEVIPIISVDVTLRPRIRNAGIDGICVYAANAKSEACITSADRTSSSESLYSLSSTSDIQNARGLGPCSEKGSPSSSQSIIPTFWRLEATSLSVSPLPLSPVPLCPGYVSPTSLTSPLCFNQAECKRTYLLEEFMETGSRSSEMKETERKCHHESTKEFLLTHSDRRDLPLPTGYNQNGDLTEVQVAGNRWSGQNIVGKDVDHCTDGSISVVSAVSQEVVGARPPVQKLDKQDFTSKAVKTAHKSLKWGTDATRAHDLHQNKTGFRDYEPSLLIQPDAEAQCSKSFPFDKDNTSSNVPKRISADGLVLWTVATK